MFCYVLSVYDGLVFLLSVTGFRLSDKLELFPMKSFNYEDPTERTFNLTLQANDSLHLTTARVTVHVLDRNDEAPKFLNRSYSVSVLENVNISHSVIQVRYLDTYKKTQTHCSFTLPFELLCNKFK